MATIEHLMDNLSAVNFNEVIRESVQETSSELLSFQRRQLYDGKMSDGNDITPSYFNDPYFKTPEAAKRYSDWKDRITPNPKRKKGTPNLFIVGTFHESIMIQPTEKSVKFNASFLEAEILNKYSEKIFGLNQENASDYGNEVMGPIATNKIKSLIHK